MLFLLDPNDPNAAFPEVSLAEREPDGLLAVGGDLSVTRLLNAYRHGIFPWFSPGDPILWWSPDPRTVLDPRRVRVSRSLRKILRRKLFHVSMDRNFDAVISACSQPRSDSKGTWLVPQMIGAYQRLHQKGYAHSVEVWNDGALAGGLYGVALGRIFFGESMFTRVSDASRVALVHLCQRLASWDFALIDCQVLTAHMVRMGAEEIPRTEFVRLVELWCNQPGRPGSWDEKRLSHGGYNASDPQAQSPPP